MKFQVSITGHDRHHSDGLMVSFDQAYSGLQKLERLFIEPDGSFVWTGEDAKGARWQVEGNLIDRGETLARAEVVGRCPAEQFDQLLGALGWPKARLVFELPRKGICLEEEEFRKLAASETGAV